MKVKATIEVGNKLEIVVADIDARDRRAFETQGRKEFGISQTANLQDAAKGIPESYLAWLVWHSLVRAKQSKESWKDFESSLVKTEAIEDSDVLDFPTKKAI